MKRTKNSSNWVSKRDTEWWDNFFTNRSQDNDSFNFSLKNEEMAKDTLKWLHEKFGRYVTFKDIPKSRTHTPYKHEILNIMANGQQNNFEAQKFIIKTFREPLKINGDYFYHFNVLEKCIITNPYMYSDEYLNYMHSNQDMTIMKLCESLYNDKCNTFIIFFNEDTPEGEEPPCGWYMI